MIQQKPKISILQLLIIIIENWISPVQSPWILSIATRSSNSCGYISGILSGPWPEFARLLFGITYPRVRTLCRIHMSVYIRTMQNATANAPTATTANR